jgi:hypothetical protein
MDCPEPRRDNGRPLRSLAADPPDTLTARGWRVSIYGRNVCRVGCEDLHVDHYLSSSSIAKGQGEGRTWLMLTIMRAVLQAVHESIERSSQADLESSLLRDKP